MSEHRSVASSAKLIAICTVVSRITGMLRDMLLLQTFGTGWVADAYNFAFQIPNLFRRLFGEGSLAAVFVPTFTHALETEGRPSAWKVLARVLALMSTVISALVILIEILILILWQTHPGGPERQLAMSLTALMLPFMLTICTVALFSSILNCLGSFVPAALTPVVMNLGMMVGILWLGPMFDRQALDRQIYGVAISVIVTGVIQIALLTPVMRKKGVALGWKLDLNNPHLREIVRRMGPILFGQGILIIGTFLDSWICFLFSATKENAKQGSFLGWTFDYPMDEGALTALTAAQRLYQFPLGVLAISIAVAALPAFSRLATHRDWPGWKSEVTKAMRLALFDGLLAGGMMIALATPIIQLLFEYRKFDPHATVRVSGILTLYGLGMWAFCVQHIVLRAFYSLGDVQTPVKISCVMVPLNLTISLILIWIDPIRVKAFAISSIITASLSVMIGFFLLQKRVGTRLLDRELTIAIGKMMLACVLSAAAAYGIHQLCETYLSDLIALKALRRALITGIPLALGTGLFLGLGLLLGLPESKTMMQYVRRRMK